MSRVFPKRNVYLLGDSVFDNKAYVSPNKDVVTLIKTYTTHDVQSYAVDGALIDDVYGQIDLIDDLKKPIVMCISVGGNDLLRNGSKWSNEIWRRYKALIAAIIAKFPKAKLNLVGLYAPDEKDKTVVEKWNRKLMSLGLQYIDTYGVIIHNTDRTHGIEPSEVGGEKLARLLVKYV